MNSQIIQNNTWSLGKKIIFRFLFVYFVLYICPFPLDNLPYGDGLVTQYSKIWQRIIPWFAKSVMNLKEPLDMNFGGSGDKLFFYLQALFFLLLSFAIVIVWTFADRRRPHYNKLLEWTIVFLRYYLAFVMLSYGFSKVFKTQFPFPNLNKLLQPFGQSTPMAVAWSYMGYSSTYTIFTGFTELMAGLLLLFRRTTTLGALVTIAVMTNVLVMNLSYDIPVKLFSSHLLFIAFFIFYIDRRRVINVFILNKPAQQVITTPLFSRTKFRMAGAVFKYLIIGYFLYSNISSKIKLRKEPWTDAGTKPPLYGIYNTVHYIQNSDTLPKMVTDSVQWKRLVVDVFSNNVYKMNDRTSRLKVTIDTMQKQLVISTYSDTTNKSFLKYSFTTKDTLLLTGKLKQDTVQIVLSKYDIKKFTLVNRGFHWVNEYPMNF